MFERYTEHARRAIFFARYEASSSGSPYIEAEHLLLGLLREDQMLRSRVPSGGIEQIRKRVEESGPRREKITTLRRPSAHYSEVYGQQRLKRKPWSRKEAFGHLIDWATTHQQWFARALTEPKVVASGYPPDEWVSAQQYSSFQWVDVVDLWLCVNRLLIHVLAQIPEDKLKIPFHIGVEKPIPLAEVIDHYIAHCEDLVGQIRARL